MFRKGFKRLGAWFAPGEKAYQVMVSRSNTNRIKWWLISPRLVRLSLSTVALSVLSAIFLTYGFFHYRHGFLTTETVRLANAEFDEERSLLVAKIAQLETTLDRVERFADRMEATLVPSRDGLKGEMVKGVGPYHPEEPAWLRASGDLATALPKTGLALGAEELNLTLKLDDLKAATDSIEARLQQVYETRHNQLVFDSVIPSIWPSPGWVTSDFGPRSQPIHGGTTFHEGIDIAAPYGSPIVVPGDGVIRYVGYRSGYGKVVVVDHSYGIVTFYAHASRLLVSEGAKVKRGDVIALIGSTGLATGAHLHFEILVDGVPIDPLLYLPKRG